MADNKTEINQDLEGSAAVHCSAVCQSCGTPMGINPDDGQLGCPHIACCAIDPPPHIVLRRDFDRETVNAAIAEALIALGKAKMKLPIELGRQLSLAHDYLLNARDWVRIYGPNDQTLPTEGAAQDS